MKYHEAIDMILDGGEAYRKSIRAYRYKFDDDGFFEQSINGVPFQSNSLFEKYDFTESDWIVEKDGVVYEEYAKTSDIVNFGICAICLKGHRPFDCKSNEYCLEKKMLCDDTIQDILRILHDYLEYMDCGQEDCSFCFPEHKDDKEDRIEEDKPEKVTVDEIMNLFEYYYKDGVILLAEATKKVDIMNSIKQKLTYLTSLQEK